MKHPVFQTITKASPSWFLGRSSIGGLLALAVLTAGCAPSGPRLISSSSVNGRTIKVYASGSAAQNSDIEQNNDVTKLKLGTHVLVINADGRVSLDGKETAYGTFSELSVTIGDGDKVEVKVIK